MQSAQHSTVPALKTSPSDPPAACNAADAAAAAARDVCSADAPAAHITAAAASPADTAMLTCNVLEAVAAATRAASCAAELPLSTGKAKHGGHRNCNKALNSLRLVLASLLLVSLYGAPTMDTPSISTQPKAEATSLPHAVVHMKLPNGTDVLHVSLHASSCVSKVLLP